MSRDRHPVPKDLVNRLSFYRKTFAEQIASGTLTSSAAAAQNAPKLLADLDKALAPFDAVTRAKVAYEESVIERTRRLPAAGDVAARAADFLRGALPTRHPLLKSKFIRRRGGKHAIPIEVRARAAEKLRETRKRNGTLGKRQREAIKSDGDFDVVVGPKGIRIKPGKK